MRLYPGWVGVAPGTTAWMDDDGSDGTFAGWGQGTVGATSTFTQDQLDAAVAILVQWKNSVLGYLSDHPERGGDALMTDHEILDGAVTYPVSGITPDPNHDIAYVPDARIVEVQQAADLLTNYIRQISPGAPVDPGANLFGPAVSVAGTVEQIIALSGLEVPVPLWPWLLFGFSVLALGLLAYGWTRERARSPVRRGRSVHRGRSRALAPV